MRCSRCGREMDEGSRFCPECGLRLADSTSPESDDATGAEQAKESPPVEEPESPGVATEESSGLPTPPSPPAAGPLPPAGTAAGSKTSGWAIASLVLGIAAFCCVPVLGAVLAIIFGAIAKSSIKKNKGELKGSGMATAGLVLGVAGLIIPIILVAVMVPVGLLYLWPKVEAQHNLHEAVNAARIYRSAQQSYAGMNASELTSIDGTIDFANAPGNRKDVVYVEVLNDNAARLYVYARTGDKYIAFANDDVWRYNFHFWDDEYDRDYRYDSDWEEWVP